MFQECIICHILTSKLKTEDLYPPPSPVLRLSFLVLWMSTWWPRSCVTLLGPAAWPPPCTPSSRCWGRRRTKRRIDPPPVQHSQIYNMIINIKLWSLFVCLSLYLFVYPIITQKPLDRCPKFWLGSSVYTTGMFSFWLKFYIEWIDIYRESLVSRQSSVPKLVKI